MICIYPNIIVVSGYEKKQASEHSWMRLSPAKRVWINPDGVRKRINNYIGGKLSHCIQAWCWDVERKTAIRKHWWRKKCRSKCRYKWWKASAPVKKWYVNSGTFPVEQWGLPIGWWSAWLRSWKRKGSWFAMELVRMVSGKPYGRKRERWIKIVSPTLYI